MFQWGHVFSDMARPTPEVKKTDAAYTMKVVLHLILLLIALMGY
jgi:hypothetical protein